MRRLLVTGSVLIALTGLVGARPPTAEPLPRRLADTGGGSQLVTAEASGTGGTNGPGTGGWRGGGRGAGGRGGAAPV
ncbi:hypothetical protein AB0890_32390, partial [Streptomyces sp. NPDC005406]